MNQICFSIGPRVLQEQILTRCGSLSCPLLSQGLWTGVYLTKYLFASFAERTQPRSVLSVNVSLYSFFFTYSDIFNCRSPNIFTLESLSKAIFSPCSYSHRITVIYRSGESQVLQPSSSLSAVLLLAI